MDKQKKQQIDENWDYYTQKYEEGGRLKGGILRKDMEEIFKDGNEEHQGRVPSYASTYDPEDELYDYFTEECGEEDEVDDEQNWYWGDKRDLENPYLDEEALDEEDFEDDTANENY